MTYPPDSSPDFRGWNAAPTLFRSENPTVAFSRLPNGGIKLRSNSIDGENVVPAGAALVEAGIRVEGATGLAATPGRSLYNFV